MDAGAQRRRQPVADAGAWVAEGGCTAGGDLDEWAKTAVEQAAESLAGFEPDAQNTAVHYVLAQVLVPPSPQEVPGISTYMPALVNSTEIAALRSRDDAMVRSLSGILALAEIKWGNLEDGVVQEFNEARALIGEPPLPAKETDRG